MLKLSDFFIFHYFVALNILGGGISRLYNNEKIWHYSTFATAFKTQTTHKDIQKTMWGSA